MNFLNRIKALFRITRSVQTWDCIVLTYDVPHRKTYDVLCLLKARGYRHVHVWATPLTYVKKFSPIYEHRPSVLVDLYPEELCRNLGFEFSRHLDGYAGLSKYKDIPILICGAGLLPLEEIGQNIIINSHPGYIPFARGLDAFKWAIYEGNPIGVTTHLIGDEIDAGEVIDRKILPIKHNDTFHSLARRVYESEIVMLVDAVERSKYAKEYVPAGDNSVHKRMPREIEELLLDRFEELKNKDKGVYV